MGAYEFNNGIDPDGALPVTLSSFTSQFMDGSTFLNWTTQSESNNLGWNIYRSDNSDLEYAMQLNYNLIPGAGTCTEPTYYTFEDETELITESTYWYWLESVSGNGETEIFGPVTLTVPVDDNEIPDLPQVTLLNSNYPNPFNPTTIISFDIREGEIGTLSIYNLRGQLVENQSYDAGSYDINWEGSKYGTGVYFYKLKTDSYSKVNKMLMLK